MMNEAHKQVLAEETTAWKPLHERCLQFHFGNVEFSCGAKLSEVSWREWDQNEAMPMFAGAHALLVDGTAPIIDNMSEEIPYQIDRVVTKVYWPDNLKEKVRIDFADGDGCEADKVVIAMPLSVLQKSPDLFEPALPLEKREALTKIGAGLIEKVAVRFKKPFWSSFLKDYELDYFSHVPAKKENRNLFNVFYDFSSKNEPNKNDCKYVLMSYVCAESVHLVQSMTDAEVVKVFIETLNDMFPATGKEDLEPLASMVTHWGSDPFIGMSYSYVRVGGTGAAYDVLAKELNRKLYFVGEHTSRFYPQTMTGAYISAQREAGKIAEHIAQEENQYDLSLDDEQP